MTFGKMVLFVALMVGVVALPSRGAAILPTDLDGVTLGDLVAGPATDDFTKVGGGDAGDLTNNVYLNDGVYTYTHTVSVAAGHDNIAIFNTFFDVIAFNGVAGWSFGEASDAGGVGDDSDFTIDEDGTGTLEWKTITQEGGTDFFDGTESITFFFQSLHKPSKDLGFYGLIDGFVASAQSFQPNRLIPAPAALPAGMALLAAFGFVRRRRLA